MFDKELGNERSQYQHKTLQHFIPNKIFIQIKITMISTTTKQTYHKLHLHNTQHYLHHTCHYASTTP